METLFYDKNSNKVTFFNTLGDLNHKSANTIFDIIKTDIYMALIVEESMYIHT